MAEQILQVKNLTKSFRGLMAVSDLDFAIEQGGILGLMGPNGAGKTTIINLISGFLKPDSGKIMWQGESIGGWKPHQVVRGGIARTFQQARVFPQLSLLDNVLVSAGRGGGGIVSAPDAGTRAAAIVEFVGLKRGLSLRAQDLPQDELRRLEIARAVASDPELILLDEPVSGLTPEESDSIADVIVRLNQGGITLLIVEHVMRMLMKVSHRLVVVNSGMKLCEGPPDEIRRDPRVMEAYLGKEGDGIA